MNEQDGRHRLRGSYPVLVVLLMLSLFAASATANEINACKYLVVGNFPSDPYGIAEELREQARAKGFTVISAANDVTQAESLKICVMTGSWNSGAYGGHVAVQVLDASGALGSEAAASGTACWSASRTVRGVVSKIYAQLGY